MLVSQLTSEERPREKCLHQGANALSLVECLAILIGSGTQKKSCIEIAREIIMRCQGEELEDHSFFYQSLHENTLPIEGIKGIGPATFTRLQAAFEIAKRYGSSLKQSQEKRPKTAKGLALRFLRKVPLHLRFERKEWIGFIPLFQDSKVGPLNVIAQGAKTHVYFEPTELFSKILLLRPYAFCLAHNHPSGDPTPSLNDREMTQTIQSISDIFSIQVLGHWVVSGPKQEWITCGRIPD